MKIRLTRGYRMYEVYDTIEFNPQDYPELNGMSDEEIIEYLNENKYDMSLNDSDETLADQFIFERDLIKDKTMDIEEEIVKIDD